MSVKVMAKVAGQKKSVEIASEDATLSYTDEWGKAHGIKQASNTGRLRKLRTFANNVLLAAQGVTIPGDKEGLVSSEFHANPEKGSEGHEVYRYSSADLSPYTVSFQDGENIVIVPATAVEQIELVDDHAEPEVEADPEPEVEDEEADEDEDESEDADDEEEEEGDEDED